MLWQLSQRVCDAISEFLGEAQGLKEKLVFRNRIGRTKIFSDELRGEYTTIGSEVMHLLLKKKGTANE